MKTKDKQIMDITTDVKLVKYILHHIPLSEELKNNLNIIFIATNLNAMRKAIENDTGFSDELRPSAIKVTQQDTNTLENVELQNKSVEVFNELDYILS